MWLNAGAGLCFEALCFPPHTRVLVLPARVLPVCPVGGLSCSRLFIPVCGGGGDCVLCFWDGWVLGRALSVVGVPLAPNARAMRLCTLCFCGLASWVLFVRT